MILPETRAIKGQPEKFLFWSFCGYSTISGHHSGAFESSLELLFNALRSYNQRAIFTID